MSFFLKSRPWGTAPTPASFLERKEAKELYQKTQQLGYDQNEGCELHSYFYFEVQKVFNEVLKIIGCNENDLDIKLENDIRRLINVVKEKSMPRYIYKSFSVSKNEDLQIVGTSLRLRGKDIFDHLRHSDSGFFIAATIGLEVDKLIAYTQKTSLYNAFLMDAIASAMVEQLCDDVQAELELDFSLTKRYSPGYGDFPLESQTDILSLLNAQQAIGLFCNESNILIPRKSITAIMGITNFYNEIDICKNCILNQKCTIRKSGGNCEYKRIC